MRSAVNFDGSVDTRNCVIDLEPSGSTITNNIPPRLSYTADEMAEIVLERDRLRKFVADIRRADSMVKVTRGAKEMRRIIRELDEE